MSKKINRTTQAKLLLLLSAVTAIGISPFIVFRAMQKDWNMVMLDITIVIGMALIFTYIYKTNKTTLPSFVFILIAQVGSIISFYINGGNIINWIYPAMLSSFFVAKPKLALGMNSVIMIIYFPKLVSGFHSSDIVIILISVLISNIIAFTFSQGLRTQEKELKKIASEDYLTGTGNRRSLTRHLDRLHTELLKNIDKTASLVILDLDHFKNVNDNYGHLVGDKALVNLSTLVKEQVGKESRVFRYGGEEFLLLCKNKGKKEAYELAETLRKKVKNSSLIEESVITISLGVAEYIKGESIAEWIHRVDVALYKAKKQGRDRVIQA